MRCRTCGADIPPEWVNAIQSNICPGCGGSIMDDGAKDLLTELTEAMEKMPNDPQGVAGWLLSHYQFRKIGDATPTERFHRPGAVTNGPGAERTDLKHAENPVDEFLKRTDSFSKAKDTRAKISQLKGGKLAQIAQDIKEGGPDPYGFDEPDAPEDDEPSVEDLKAMRAMMRSGKNPFAGSESAGGVKDHNNALSAQEIVAIQEYSDEQQQPLQAEDDELLPQEKALSVTKEGRDVVMKNRIKRIRAQESILDEGGAGGSGGAFWRS